MVSDPTNKGPLNHADNDALGDDPFLDETLGSLEDIRVPSDFLPTVMYQVYERHHRNTLRWGRVTLTALVLAALAAIFFFNDVRALQSERNLAGFSEAFDVRLDEIISRVEAFSSSIGSVLAASWQLLLGTVREAPVMTVVILVALVATIWLVRKLLMSTLR